MPVGEHHDFGGTSGPIEQDIAVGPINSRRDLSAVRCLAADELHQQDLSRLRRRNTQLLPLELEQFAHFSNDLIGGMRDATAQVFLSGDLAPGMELGVFA